MSALDLADYLRVRLRALHMTTTEAAKRSGISRQTWHKLLRAEIGEARLSTLIQVADTLETHPLSMLRIFFNGREVSQVAHREGNTAFVLGFVADVTFPDTSEVHVGQEFEKIWEVANLGKEPWVGWRLQCVSGQEDDNLLPVNESVAIPETPPGATARLAVRLRAPGAPCNAAISHWKCVNAEGELVLPNHAGLYCMVKVMPV
ncbi:Helix-turn-helix domain-containing protein [Thiothrix caldifontis]|uniref:Helix-turn-helix domain-containing protein n=1 Tax=Thiothrix caldifontis TaxID=525918 RepID=A0A1H3ZBK2_9GAMM|nr:NBR1-Ig-like domain-containing protein [Thiothrix caldifontis]SEA21146.1 Helix-turn-helix domain-containing protein [Thiothrix caldifontis]